MRTQFGECRLGIGERRHSNAREPPPSQYRSPAGPARRARIADSRHARHADVRRIQRLLERARAAAERAALHDLPLRDRRFRPRRRIGRARRRARRTLGRSRLWTVDERCGSPHGCRSRSCRHRGGRSRRRPSTRAPDRAASARWARPTARPRSCSGRPRRGQCRTNPRRAIRQTDNLGSEYRDGGIAPAQRRLRQPRRSSGLRPLSIAFGQALNDQLRGTAQLGEAPVFRSPVQRDGMHRAWRKAHSHERLRPDRTRRRIFVAINGGACP
ncbi:putative MFS transporter domain protein [Burkholderia thailandensis H0587]|nr:putative MFS transporter domain protein [Burkholderia thailandensis H0587]